jgi:Domain of unknown function (DUF4234)
MAADDYTTRNPLGVLGLSIITLGIYWLYWYYKVNDEMRRFEKDETIRPGMALLAVSLGWILIIPPFISVYNTGRHVAHMEERVGLTGPLSPALNLLVYIVLAVGTGLYVQEHLNRVWEVASRPRLETPISPGVLPAPPQEA